jgi:hypothetical protein
MEVEVAPNTSESQRKMTTTTTTWRPEWMMMMMMMMMMKNWKLDTMTNILLQGIIREGKELLRSLEKNNIVRVLY